MRKIYFLMLYMFSFGVFSQNLIINSDFKKVTKQNVPVGWFFDNCSQNSLLIPSVEQFGRKKAAVIRVADHVDTPDLYGYWSQTVKLDETGEYILRFKMMTENMNKAYWLYNVSDGSSARLKWLPASDGEIAHEVLSKFIDSKYLLTFRAAEWTEYSVKINVPKLTSDKKYAVKLGVIGTGEGWMAITDVWFGKAPTNK